MIEFNEESSKITKSQTYKHPGVVDKVFPNPKNENEFYTSFTECL